MDAINLWLDDVRDPAEHGCIGWLWVKTADEAIEVLKTGRVVRASLDHDLSVEAAIGKPAPDERTGYTVCCWLEEHPDFWPMGGVRVHSLNPAGRQRMQTVIDKFLLRDYSSDGRASDS